MSSSRTETPSQLEELILKGQGRLALESINSVLSSRMISKEVKVIYNLLKCKALVKTDQYFQAISLLDEISSEITITGSPLQKLDYLCISSENLLYMGNANEGLRIIKEAEEFFEDIVDKDSTEVTIKRVNLLIIKTQLQKLLFGFIDETYETAALGLKLSEDFNYEYGKGRSLEQLATIHCEVGHVEEALKCAEEAHTIWQKTSNQFEATLTTFQIGLYLPNTEPEQKMTHFEEAKKMAEELNAKNVLSKIHNSLAIMNFNKDEKNLGIEHFEMAMNISKEIGDKFGLTTYLFNLGQVYSRRMEYERASTYLYEALAIAKELDFERPYYLIQFSLTGIYVAKGEYNRALKFAESAVEFYSTKNIPENLAWSRGRLANILHLKGDLDNGLTNYLLCLEYYEGIQRLASVCDTQNQVGEIYQLKGDNKLALKYYHSSEEIAIRNEYKALHVYTAFKLISCYLDMGEIEKAKEYLETLNTLGKDQDSKDIEITLRLSTALVLNKEEDSDNRKKAKELLESIISEKEIEHKIVLSAILNLCENLLTELRITEEMDFLEELKYHVKKLHQEGTAELAYPLLIQSIWLESQIALIELDVAKARRLFNSAQIMAEGKGYHTLARKISDNHDQLLEQLDLWEKFTMQLPSVAERMELTHIESVMEEMVRGKGLVFSEAEFEDEESSLIFIFSETGVVLYLEQFEPDLDPDLIQKVSSNILERIHQSTRIGYIERTLYDEYTYLIKKIEGFIFCYVFIGKSYQGIKKLDEFSQLIYGTNQVWEDLVSVDKDEKSLGFQERLIITQYVDNIFI